MEIVVAGLVGFVSGVLVGAFAAWRSQVARRKRVVRMVDYLVEHATRYRVD